MQSSRARLEQARGGENKGPPDPDAVPAYGATAAAIARCGEPSTAAQAGTAHRPQDRGRGGKAAAVGDVHYPHPSPFAPVDRSGGSDGSDGTSCGTSSTNISVEPVLPSPPLPPPPPPAGICCAIRNCTYIITMHYDYNYYFSA